MKLNYDINSICSNELYLLVYQIDLVLDDLSFYMYTYRFVYNKKECETEEENLRISLVRDTYCQISGQFNKSKSQNPINELIISDPNNDRKKFKKVA